jgi:hypothetical protein
MNKKNIDAPIRASEMFPGLKAYSVDEILAGGGTTAFAEKLGKNFENIEHRLKKLPKDAFLTDEEIEEALKMLRESK